MKITGVETYVLQAKYVRLESVCFHAKKVLMSVITYVLISEMIWKTAGVVAMNVIPVRYVLRDNVSCPARMVSMNVIIHV